MCYQLIIIIKFNYLFCCQFLLLSSYSSKCISKWLSNGKAPKYEANLFIHVKGLLYKHATDSHQKFLALMIPKAWKYTVLVEAYDKLGHQGSTWTYCLIKWLLLERNEQRYKEIHCPMCPLWQRKSKSSSYPLQMTEIPEHPIDKIAMDLVTECGTSSSGNKHILTILDHLTGWLEAFPIPGKSADTMVSTLINQYLPVHMCPGTYCQIMAQNSKNIWWIRYFNSWELNTYSLHPTIPRATENWKCSTNISNPPWRNYVKRTHQIGTSI